MLRITPDAPASTLAALAGSLGANDRLVVTTHVRTSEGAGRFAVAPSVAAWVDSVALRVPTVVVAHGNPYVLQQFPHVAAYLATFGRGDALERAAARAVAGVGADHRPYARVAPRLLPCRRRIRARRRRHRPDAPAPPTSLPPRPASPPLPTSFAMTLTPLDWAIVAAYFLLSTLIGLYFTKRGGENLSEYFLSGRQVPWWLAGAAMVATTFAADTPLVVTGLVTTKGVAGNWLWWNFVMSGILTVFFFARLWRRAEVMTDVEFAEVRYGGRPAAFLRGFRAIYLAIPINLIILGWVTRAMIKILTISLGVSPILAVGICFVITMAYSLAAGLWAVLWTDLIQFVLGMTATIILSVFAVRAVGGMDALKAGAIAHFGSERAALSVLPLSFTPDG